MHFYNSNYKSLIIQFRIYRQIQLSSSKVRLIQNFFRLNLGDKKVAFAFMILPTYDWHDIEHLELELLELELLELELLLVLLEFTRIYWL